MRLRPPAKLNRFLHITGRRADGYHLLQTAFDLIDWCDELDVVLRDDGLIERIGGIAEVAVDDDLVVRAARVLQPLAPAGAGCTLTLTKHIPTGAGLGGGSADAAATLLALNHLWQLRLGLDDLIRIGARLGADVPVFLGQQPAFAEGIGELLQPLPFVHRHYLVVHPGVALATGPMFAHPALRRDCSPVLVAQYLAGGVEDNVFAPVARALAPAVVAAMDWLQARCGHARLTGSGSAVFAEVADPVAAQAHLAELPVNWRGRVVASVANWFDNALARAGK